MSEQAAIRSARGALDRALRRTRLVEQPPDPSAQNALAGIHPDLLSFRPGERTRDNGSLGDISGRIEIIANTASGPLDWILWRDGVETGRATSAGTGPVTVLAGEPGRYRLSIKSADTEIGSAYVTVPQVVQMVTDTALMRPTFDACGIPQAQHDAILSEVLSRARNVAHHILRPANCRLIWPGEDLPPQFSLGPAPDDRTIQAGARMAITDTEGQASGLMTIRIVNPSHAALQMADALDALTTAMRNSIPGLLAARALRLLADLTGLDPETSDELQQVIDAVRSIADAPAWGFDGTFSGLNLATIRAGLGHLAFDGTPLAGTDGTPADIVLREQAAAVQAGDWARAPVATRAAFIEAAGRMIGVNVARGVLRLVGLPDEPAEDAHLRDTNNVIAAGIMAPAPENPVRDLLGLDPDDTTVDLVTRANSDVPAFRHARHLHGPMSGYDALCGIVTDASLDALAARLGPLPPAYGPYSFAPGDTDDPIPPHLPDAPFYGGAARIDAQSPPRPDMIALIQRDLAATGTLTGLLDTPTGPRNAAAKADSLHSEGRYGYVHFVNNVRRFNGRLGNRASGEGRAANRVRFRGHTGFAVREFQIAHRYPNIVCERLDGGANYADRLGVVGTSSHPDRAGVAAIGTPAPEIDGVLDVLTADDLRTWRFRRRRNPVVIVAGARNDATPFAAQGGAGPIHNVGQVEHIINEDLRLRAFDLSGYSRGDRGPVNVGKYEYFNARSARITYGGQLRPRSERETTLDITLANILGPGNAWNLPATLGPNERQRRERLHSIYRTLRGTSYYESMANFGSSNSWDSAAYSYPPFHYTLTTRRGIVSVMGGFLRWLMDPPDPLLLSSVYPDFNQPDDAPNLPTGYPPADYDQNQAGVQRLRDELRAVMQKCFAEAFGHFGVGAGDTEGTKRESFVTIAGMHQVASPPNQRPAIVLDMTRGRTDHGGPSVNSNDDRKYAVYQSYADWFRGWQWIYRFDAAMHASQTLRTLCFAYAVDWAHDVMATRMNQVRSEAGRSALLRVIVKGDGNLNAGDLTGFLTGTPAQERANIRTGILPRTAGVFGTTLDAMDHDPPDAGVTFADRTGHQDPLVEGTRTNFYDEVRNYIIRTMIHGQVND